MRLFQQGAGNHKAYPPANGIAFQGDNRPVMAHDEAYECVKTPFRSQIVNKIEYMAAVERLRILSRAPLGTPNTAGLQKTCRYNSRLRGAPRVGKDHLLGIAVLETPLSQELSDSRSKADAHNADTINSFPWSNPDDRERGAQCRNRPRYRSAGQGIPG